MKNNLGRDSSHAKALFMNLAKSLILHKRITTTRAKGKILRRYIEPILTKTKVDSIHSRRIVFSYFQDKEVVKELFNEVAPKVAARPGGYVRVINTYIRKGDSTQMCMVELVDYNTIYSRNEDVSQRQKTRRSRKKKINSALDTDVKSDENSEEKISDEIVS